MVPSSPNSMLTIGTPDPWCWLGYAVARSSPVNPMSSSMKPGLRLNEIEGLSPSFDLYSPDVMGSSDWLDIAGIAKAYSLVPSICLIWLPLTLNLNGSLPSINNSKVFIGSMLPLWNACSDCAYETSSPKARDWNCAYADSVNSTITTGEAFVSSLGTLSESFWSGRYEPSGNMFFISIFRTSSEVMNSTGSASTTVFRCLNSSWAVSPMRLLALPGSLIPGNCIKSLSSRSFID